MEDPMRSGAVRENYMALARGLAVDDIAEYGRDLEPVAESVGLNIVDSGLTVGVCGVTSRDANGELCLTVQAGLTIPLRRWTVARAIGAAAFHDLSGVKEFTFVDPTDQSRVADFAFEYAAELLMPRDEFIKSMSRGNVGQAILFDVPVSVVRPRAAMLTVRGVRR